MLANNVDSVSHEVLPYDTKRGKRMDRYVSMKISSELLGRICEMARRDKRTRSDMMRILIDEALASRLDAAAERAEVKA